MRKSLALAIVMASLFANVGCDAFLGPYKAEQFVEIGPHETAFVVPLEGENLTTQTKTQMTAEQLAEHRVNSKRISLTTRWKSTGRLPGSGEWVPSVAVRKVNRAPVTREWVQQPVDGTDTNDDALFCETSDSIKLFSGCAISARILEEDSHVYLYHFGERQLAEVVDKNMRGFCQMELAKIIKTTKLEDARHRKAEHFDLVFGLVANEFKAVGVTVDFFGNDGGYNYTPAVQKSIDAAFEGKINAEVAHNEKLAQDERNEITVATAKAEKAAAELQLDNKDATEFATNLNILKTRAKARVAAANKFSKAGGSLPEYILPTGGAGGAPGASLMLQVADKKESN